jgi:hypothetical protein
MLINIKKAAWEKPTAPPFGIARLNFTRILVHRFGHHGIRNIFFQDFILTGSQFELLINHLCYFFFTGLSMRQHAEKRKEQDKYWLKKNVLCHQ